LPEPLRAQARRDGHAADPGDPLDAHPSRSRELGGQGPPRIETTPRRRFATLSLRLGLEAGEGHQTTTRGDVGSGEDGAVSVETIEVREPRPEPDEPQPDRQLADPVCLGHRGQRGTADPGGHRGEHDLDSGHLARQGIARQHPLPVPALLAPRDGDAEHEEGRRGMELPVDARLRQPHARRCTTCTAAPGHQLRRAGTGDDLLVPARVNVEYVSHVLVTALGSAKTAQGRLLFYR